MKTVLWILAIAGSFVGGVIVLVAIAQWVRHASARS
jgi:hypothetical protein